MSPIEIKRRIAEKMRLPPRKPPPADIKEQMAKIKAEIERRKKDE